MMQITEFLRKLAPEFMWCSVKDLFLMYEQINEDVDWFSFNQTFHYLYRVKGLFLSKPDPTSKHRWLYLKIIDDQTERK